jgi:hypothetical protein
MLCRFLTELGIPFGAALNKAPSGRPIVAQGKRSAALGIHALTTAASYEVARERVSHLRHLECSARFRAIYVPVGNCSAFQSLSNLFKGIQSVSKVLEKKISDLGGLMVKPVRAIPTY